MKQHGKTIKPRDVAAMALKHCRGGCHGKTEKAQRQQDRQQLKQQLKGWLDSKGSKEPFLTSGLCVAVV
ncbi:hypothetical protein [Parachitinimonas caeni]|uniref:Uncharacterized protein n=1 Tax=Parachitinimonas caeni TaxID=3031301 RepID=A0ABT7E3B0_9NEIS|nr:hypothetical protein [Parachitinimonas caeni]MDK2126796.1 hypothetical protein [Parachitinimonas caeni]